MRNKHGRTWNMARKPRKHGKLDTQTVGPVIWRKNRQTRKMRISHGRTCNMVGNTEKREKR